MIDVETYGAAVGAAKRYTDEHSGSDDAVKYTEQTLTTAQQAQARENIGAAASTDIPTDDDDDYYPMLGQVYDWGTGGYRYGFKSTLSNGNSIIDIIFYSDDNNTSTAYSTVFGDFRVRVSTSASRTTIYLIVPNGAVVDTSRPWIHVQNGYCLFANCSITTNLSNAISKFDTSRVKNMARMFTGITTTSLSALDLSSFDTRKVKNMDYMFSDATAITTLDLSSFDMSNVVTYTDMFGYADHWTGITTLKTPKINPHDDIPLPRTLYSQDGTAYTNLPVTTGTSIELRASWT